MKKFLGLFIAVSFLTTVSCKSEKKKEAETPVQEETKIETPAVKKITVTMEPKSESEVKGNVVFTEENGVVTMTAVFEGLAPGEHAIHLHEKADCSAEDGTSSGGHWNPTFAQHGKWGSPDGYHKGDIGNFTADENGNGTITFETDEWCIGCGDANKDIVGKAVIVHQGTDDYVSQPSGAAGARVSCGGVIQ
ncbi:superoxide dismutase family protein [Robertkochia solimangrovi]|uniref:superoxide dismutase family protein n=1 Tax=Robertkochia solimangrovi TaxID=2213046 RepID=UPI001180AA76|nr:superoxide dismutase family protein [Robertkochia solimangrovi]TRZ43812.1 superoxide dismutase family protein [Robertkochia solimangrovi]